MKLKKIASLMLAGIMAISMLAGCSGKGETKPEEPATGVNATTVIAALDKKVTDKVTFTASSSLQTTLEKAVQYVGTEKIGEINRKDLTKFDTTLVDAGVLCANKIDDVKSEEWYKKAENNSITRVVVLDDVDYSKYTDAAVVEALAKEVNDLKIADSDDDKINATQTAAELVSYNNKDFEENGSKYYYTFKYTGTMAVTKVVGDNGTSYVVALTVTRVPSKATKG
ncbi:hypothetical protein B5G28_03195 [Faecalibacterium sp. An77]|uniref:hypothetical protein n=1 Tax=Faecalibacterium sp. An77 TaxID=1965655 RepID=UPI000B3659E5|nr:hypothetical protein [Faecalibacterium sp. An77]OUN39886.1 hypothetical protein B5G28_03195 [Faecalibacterium sp. An77]